MATELIGNIKGVKGDIGETPNIQIGTVTTLPPTDNAFATMSGTAENPRLNLGIPQGEKGETGDVTEEQMNEAIATAEATVRPISAGGTGESQRRIDISSSFTPYKVGNVPNIITTGDKAYKMTAYYYPYEKICRFRFYAQTNISFSSNVDEGSVYTMGTFSQCKPDSIHILSARMYKPINYAAIDDTGAIKLKTAPNISFSTNVEIFITGWWFCENPPAI